MVREPQGREVLETAGESGDFDRALIQANRLATVGLLVGGLAHRLNQELVYILFHLDGLGRAVSEVQAFLARLEPRLQRAMGSEDARRVIELADETGLRAELDGYASGQRDAFAGAGRVRDLVKTLQLYLWPEPMASGAVDLHQILDRAVELVRGEIEVRARLVREYGEGVPPPRGDAASLSHVFLQLLVNTVQSLPDGHASAHEVRIETESRDDSIRVRISHDGDSVPEALRERLFEPFVAGRPGTAGLGLYVVHRLLKDLGGSVTLVEDAPGTAFEVRLPIARPEADAEAEELERESARNAVRQRILVVDDEEMVLAVVSRALGDLHEVICARSGLEAMEIIDKDAEFDLVLCDLHMSEVSGAELYDHVALAHPDLARRFVIMTAGAFTPATVEFLKRVPNVQIRKPFDVLALRDFIAGLL